MSAIHHLRLAGATLTIVLIASALMGVPSAHAASASSAGAADIFLVRYVDGQRPDLATEYGVLVRKHYSVINGTAISATPAQAEFIASDPRVSVVERNRRFRVGSPGTKATAAISWGLDRIDQPRMPLDGTYHASHQGGAGVNVYLVDSGVDYRHPDLYPRAHPAFDAFGGDGSDELGNGTFVAGIIGGKDAGVAKKAQLFSVKALDGQGAGSLEGIIASIEWITKNARRPAVAHVSIGVPPNDLLDDAVRASIASGVTYVIEAGGDATDTDNDSPARVREAVTVGASDREDYVADFSNYGPALDLFAPGVDITSDVSGGGRATMSGVQYASAHTAGAAALVLGKHRNLSPKCVERALVDASVSSLSGVPADTPNRLLQVPSLGSSTSLSCDALPTPVADVATHEVN